MIRATEDDRPAIAAFLADHMAVSMFPASNLARYGMAGGHPRAMSFWLRWQDGRIADIVSISDEGMVFPMCPTGPWADVATVMRGALVKGVIGAADQVSACRAALGLTRPADLDDIEPHYKLSLDALEIPSAGNLGLHSLQAADLNLLITWRAEFCIETLLCTRADAFKRAINDVRSYLDDDTYRVLMDGDVPLAMTGFNAVLPQVVQVGGVYTPPKLRARGYARLAVALHLAEVREMGVRDAVLSSANEAASRAYEAIGFRTCGRFSIAAFNEPQVIHG